MTLVIGVGCLGGGGALFLFSDDPLWIPVLFMGGFGLVFTWISIRGLLSPDFGEGGPDTTREPSQGEVKEAINETIRSPMFIIGAVLFMVGPGVGFVVPLGGLGVWIPPIAGFLLMGIAISRNTQGLYR